MRRTRAQVLVIPYKSQNVCLAEQSEATLRAEKKLSCLKLAIMFL
jgi:hypothetical protein